MGPGATIFWLAKMITVGEDPRFVARCLLVTAAEDVGLADPQALVIANAAFDAAEKLGLPEARIPLAEAVIWVPRAPKSNAAIVAIDRALDDIQNKGLVYSVPNHLEISNYRDTKIQYGYGVDYKYHDDYHGHLVAQEYLPKELQDKSMF